MSNYKCRLKWHVSSVAVIACVTGANVSAQESPQESESGIFEEIVISGIRGSLQRATEAKRNRVNSVEAIMPQDMGKLPDQNVAESLQRVPGVTIERNRGDGQYVSVRGLGPDFNAVTVNGRTIATDNIGRAFSFDVLPSELISGAMIYKSPTAAVNGASIGATIDIATARPLKLKPFQAVMNARVTHGQLDGSESPSFSGLVSYHNEDSTFGVAIAASYVERSTRTDAFEIGAGHTPRSSAEGGYFYGRTADDIPEFTDIDTPSNLSSYFSFRDDSRLGLNATVQYSPTPSLVMTFDALYTKLEQTDDDVGLAYDFSGGTLVEQVVEGNSAVYQRIEGGFVDMILDRRERPAETRMFGYNAEWANDQFEVVFDVAYSDATLAADGLFTTIRRTDMDLYFDRRVDSPIYDFGFSSPNYANAAVDTDHVGAHYMNHVITDRKDEVLEFKLDAKWDNGEGVAISAGVSRQSRKKTTDVLAQDFSSQCAFCGGTEILDSSLFAATGLTWFEEHEGDVVRDWIRYDERELNALLLAHPGPYVDWMETDGYTAPVASPEQSSVVEEKVLLGYLMFDLETELGGMPLAVNTGVRIESTNFSSSGAAQTVLSAKPNGLGQNIIELSDVVPISFEGDYTDILPSLNARLDLTDTLVARFAASRVMTRPTLSDLSPAQTILSNPGNEAISRGNPNLQPFRATQMELGAEWYFDEMGMLSITGFYKSIDSFVTLRTTPELVDEVVFQVTQPENGEGADVKGFEIGYRQAFDSLPAPFDGLGAEASYTYVSSNADFTNEVTGVNYGLEGLSKNSVTLVGFYEKGPIQARLAYTSRDAFLQVAFGRNGDPEFFDDYEQLDASFSYDLTDNLTLSLEALNLTNAKEFIYSTTSDRTKVYRTTGRRFIAGLRASF